MMEPNSSSSSSFAYFRHPNTANSEEQGSTYSGGSSRQSTPVKWPSRPPSQLSDVSSSSVNSSPGKSPCRQCSILERRRLAQELQRSSSQSPKPSPEQHHHHHHHHHHYQNQPQTQQQPFDATQWRPPSTSTPLRQAAKIAAAATAAVAPRELFSAETTDASQTEAAKSSAPHQFQRQLHFEDFSFIAPKATAMSSAAYKASVAIAIFFLTSILVIFTILQRVQPLPFIDEVFHIPQAQKYCVDNNFSSWDNKITTPPGLYLVSYAIIRPVGALFGVPHAIACSVNNLRLVNVLFSGCNFMIIWAMLKSKLAVNRDSGGSLEILLQAIAVSLFPPFFFFSFFYYTDVGSMFTILLVQWSAMKGHHMFAAIAGFASLWFRQTNIVWLFLTAAFCCLNITYNLIEDYQRGRKYEFFLLGFTKNFPLRECHLKNWRYCLCLLYDFTISVLSTCGGYVLNGILFVGFLYLNEGIVLGDRSAHLPVFHVAQIPYFLSFVTFIGAPVIFTMENARHFYRLAGTTRGAILFLLSSTSLYLALSDRFRYVHPYLIADNRHYVFYIWRRIWSNEAYPELRTWPIPLYIFTMVSMWHSVEFVPQPVVRPSWGSPRKNTAAIAVSLRATQHVLAKLLFSLLIIVTIVPQQLLELRYFIVPYLLWRLHLKKPSTRWTIFFELAWALLINAATLYIFATRTIKYSDTEPHSRIIW